MSKQNIALTRGEGTSTSRTLANTAETVKKIGMALDEHAMLPLRESADVLREAEGLLGVIRKFITTANGFISVSPELRKILRDIGFVASAAEGRTSQARNFAECELETLRDETIPAIIAALEGK